MRRALAQGVVRLGASERLEEGAAPERVRVDIRLGAEGESLAARRIATDDIVDTVCAAGRNMA